MEAGIEVVNLVFKFLFYKGKKALERDIEIADDVSPYEIPSIEKLSLLALHRKTLDHLWELVKFRGWNYSVRRNENNEEVMYEDWNINAMLMFK